MNQNVHTTHGAEQPEEQIRKDNELIPNPGQMRVIIQQGAINHKGSNGEVISEPVEIRFERTRNEKGTVDVKAIMPKPLGMSGSVHKPT